jgi:hypothetical protein
MSPLGEEVLNALEAARSSDLESFNVLAGSAASFRTASFDVLARPATSMGRATGAFSLDGSPSASTAKAATGIASTTRRRPR